MTPVREAVVDLDALRHNIDVLAARVAPARLMVVVKADAYGHGLLPVARAVERAGIGWLGVLDAESALAVRGAGVRARLLTWLHPPGSDFTPLVAADVDLGVSRRSELDAGVAAARATGETARVHLKLDTGLHRNGASEADWPALVAAAAAAERAGGIRVAGLWTHIAEASEEDDTDALALFERSVARAAELGVVPEVRHLAASSAGFRRADVRLDLVRMGGHCWGIPSFDGVTPEQMGLVPVMTATSTVLDVTGGVATIASGYLHGIPHDALGRVAVAVRGRRHALDLAVGAHTTRFHVTDDVVAGDTAVLFGSGASGEQTVREWGDATGTLGDEIVCQVGTSVPRRYVGTGA